MSQLQQQVLTHGTINGANGIDAKCHYPIAIHQQEGYPRGESARMAGQLTNSEHNAACCISLPMYPELTEEEVHYVVGKVLEWDNNHQDSPAPTFSNPSPGGAN
jgi:dTDP-4-amino-4,6-dideoxygalactose transaminase